jgi:chromosome segregation ATPase
MPNPVSNVVKLKKQVKEQQQLLEAEQGKASLQEMGRQELIAEQVKFRQQTDQLKRLIRQHQANLNRMNRRVSGFTEQERQEEPIKVKRLKKERDELKKHLESYRERIAELTSKKESQKEKIQDMEKQGVHMMMTNKSHEIRLRSLQGSLVQAKIAQMKTRG